MMRGTHHSGTATDTRDKQTLATNRHPPLRGAGREADVVLPVLVLLAVRGLLPLLLRLLLLRLLLLLLLLLSTRASAALLGGGAAWARAGAGGAGRRFPWRSPCHSPVRRALPLLRRDRRRRRRRGRGRRLVHAVQWQRVLGVSDWLPSLAFTPCGSLLAGVHSLWSL